MLRHSVRAVCALLLAASLSGCAMFISDPEERAEVMEANDPIEGLNRQIFAVNLALDTFLLRPVSVVYGEFMPNPGKDMVHNFVQNLKLPFTMLNDLAQGETDRAQTAISRFLVNTVVGVGGLFYAATGLGLNYHEEDFGQTMAVYDSEEGPYLMLPIFGPSNLRDAIGLVVQYFADPVGIAADEADADNFGLIRGGMDAVDSRYRHGAEIDALQRQSLDFYAAIRSLYRQRRAAEISNSTPGDVPSRPISQLPAKSAPADKEAAMPTAAAKQAAAAAKPDIRAIPARPVVKARLDRPLTGNTSTPEPEAPAVVGSEPASARGTELAAMPEAAALDNPFAEALKDFDAAARSFDQLAGTAAEAR